MSFSRQLSSTNIENRSRGIFAILDRPHLWPTLIFAISALLPRELAISISGAVLFPYRLVLLCLIPFILAQLLKRPPSLSIFDFLAGTMAIWMIVSLSFNEPLRTAIEGGSALALDFGLAYLLGRVSFRCSDDFRILFIAFLPVLAGVAAIQAIESIGQRQILRPLFAQLLNQPPPDLHSETRLGLFRAAGPFQHPILGGIFMATMLPMAWFLPESRLVKAFGVVIACGMIFTVSSSAILAFLVCAFLIGMLWIQRLTKWPIWLLILVSAGTIFFLIATFSETGPLKFVARYFSISVHTGYWRVFIWEYAGAEALNNPLFGIGFREWVRPWWMLSSSIDAHYLLLAVRFGLIVGVGYLVLILGAALRLLTNMRYQSRSATRVSLAIAFALIGFAAAATSTAFWEGIAAWMTMLCGAAISLSSPPWQQTNPMRNLLSIGHAQNPAIS